MIFTIRGKAIRKRAADYVARITSDELMCVEIKPYKDMRTKLQNSYYWAVMKQIGEHTGYDDQEMHSFFKDRFLHKEPVCVLGEYVKTETSTTGLNKKEFVEYMEKIAMFCANTLDFIVPPPDYT